MTINLREWAVGAPKSDCSLLHAVLPEQERGRGGQLGDSEARKQWVRRPAVCRGESPGDTAEKDDPANGRQVGALLAHARSEAPQHWAERRPPDRVEPQHAVNTRRHGAAPGHGGSPLGHDAETRTRRGNAYRYQNALQEPQSDPLSRHGERVVSHYDWAA